MRFKDVFSIIGPDMIGPSSSHTAGALRIGRIARQLLGKPPKRADITFLGSFAETYRGHGTDVAIVAGLLDFDTDDDRIPESLAIAKRSGLNIRFFIGKGTPPHPNTAQLRLHAGRRHMQMTGCSIGGGNIEVVELMGFDVRFSGSYPTLVIYHGDRKGVIAEVTGLLSGAGINIGYMDVDRRNREGDAVTVVETDNPLPETLRTRIARIKSVKEISYANLNGGET